MAEVASAWVSILPSAKGFGSKLESEVSGDVKGVGSKLGKGFGKAFAIGGGLVAAVGIKGLFDGAMAEAREGQKVGALTESIIKSTGGAANVTAKQVGTLSGAISEKVGVDDEAIQSGANLLLTFKKVRNEVGAGNKIFDRATKAATDLSAAGFGDMAGQSKMLGKALNDPVKGITALTRSGVTFTDQQKNQIKALVASGKTLKAQKMILKEVESQVGGAAAATATEGDKAAVALGNIKEQVGTALLPAVDSLAGTFTGKVAPAVSGFITGMQEGTGAGGQFVSAVVASKDALMGALGFINQHRTAVTALAIVMGTLVAVTQIHAAVLAVSAAGGMLKYLQGLKLVSAATKVYAAVQWVLNAALTANPIGLIIVGLSALGAGLVIAYKKSTTFRNIVNAAFSLVKKAAAGVVNFFTTSVPAAFNRVRGAAASVLGWVKGNWPKILAVLTGPFGIAALLIYKNWAKIKAGGVMVLNWIKALPGQIKGAFSGAAGWLKSAGADIVRGLGVGIESMYDWVRGKVDALSGWIPGWVKKKLGIASPSKVMAALGIWIPRGLAEGIDKGTPAAIKAAKALAQKTIEGVKTQIDAFKSLRDAVKSAYAPDLFSATPAMFGVGLKQQLGINNAVIAAVKKLKGMKLNPGFLSGLIQSGNFDLITALAGAGTSTVKAQQADWLAVQKTASQLGVQTAEAVTGKKLDGLQAELKRLNKAVSRLAKDTGREVSKGVNKSASDARRNSR